MSSAGALGPAEDLGAPGTDVAGWSRPVRALLLDVDDTLVDTLGAMHRALVQSASRVWSGCDEEVLSAFARRYYTDPGGFFDEYTRGERTFAQMRRARFDDAVSATRLDPVDEVTYESFENGYRADLLAAQRLFVDVDRLLDRAESAGVPVVLLTNSSGEVTREKMAVVGLTSRIASVVTTDTLGFGKPDPRVFAYACAAVGVPPEDVLCVGDTIGTDVVGARRSGIRVLWLQRRDSPEPRDAGWNEPVCDPGVRVISTLDEVLDVL
ncbi:HAD family hydrolase [Austwickia chelonae]|uniref:HAD family hydrolase n=1 Tax=Austwickia chelonae TaxID=100225 RepID=UPI001F0808EA|nr:HAD family hydrolase [Austwickia chelonae]